MVVSIKKIRRVKNVVSTILNRQNFVVRYLVRVEHTFNLGVDALWLLSSCASLWECAA